MTLSSPSDVRALLAQIGMTASKSLGQNFLVDRNIRDIIIAAAASDGNDRVLEIGPGLGVLTEELVRTAGQVTAIELDRRLFDHLEAVLGNAGNLTLIHGDITDMDICDFRATKIVANLPYSVGSRVMMDIAWCDPRPGTVVVTLQEEVARRLAASPGGRDYGLTTVWVQLGYEVKIVKNVSRTCFYPRPRVESAMVSLRAREDADRSHIDMALFRALTKYAFMHRRKQMCNILDSAPGGVRRQREEAKRLLGQVGIDPTLRPERLGVEEWCELANALTVPG